MVDFLRLSEIAPKVFEQSSESKISELARQVQAYRNSISKDQAHVPFDFNRDLYDSQLQWDKNSGVEKNLGAQPGFAIGGIMEQFEDDFDSDDSEFQHHTTRYDDGSSRQLGQ